MLTAYSKSGAKYPACVRCGIVDIRCLSLDHVAGGGNKARSKIGYGEAYYKQLARAGYPAGYQTLCMNCQFIKRYLNREFGGGYHSSVSHVPLVG